MYIKRKRGFVLLETLIVINILMVLISLYTKQNFINLRKAKYYTIKEDIMTLNVDEEKLISEAEINISSDVELIMRLKENGADEKIKIISAEDKKLWIEIFEKEIYLIHKNGLNKRYRKLEYEIVGEPMKINLSPTRYVTAYTNK